MNIKNILKSEGTLRNNIALVDASAKIYFDEENETLNVSISNPNSQDKLTLVFENFNLKYNTCSDGFLVSESFFIVIRKISSLNDGKKFIKPFMDFLNEILALVILIPNESYLEIDYELIKLIAEEYYPNGQVEYDEISYETFQSAQSMV